MPSAPGRPATPPMLRDLNERTVLEAIRAHPPVSRAEISRRVGISKPTVSLALRSLLDAGLVREADGEQFRPRYGATFFEPVPEAALVLGVDVGARFLRGALSDLSGRVRARQDVEVPAPAAPALLDAIADMRASVVATAGLEDARIDSVVVGVPGVAAEPEAAITMAE